MPLEELVSSRKLCTLGRQGPLGPYLDGFVESASTAGYTPLTLVNLVRRALRFGRFLEDLGLTDLHQLDEEQVEAFLQDPAFVTRKGHPRRAPEAFGARQVLRYLREIGIVAPAVAAPRSRPQRHARPAPPPCPDPPVLEEWLSFLQKHQGLDPSTLRSYRRPVLGFLKELGPDATPEGLRRLDLRDIRDHIARRAGILSRDGRKRLLSTLRIFLRFALGRGYLARDLAACIERIPSWKHESLPRGPGWDAVAKLPDTIDRASSQGRRDYALLLMLITYGVRGCQVRRLILDQIDWRARQIAFPPTKRGKPITVPLTDAIGQAILDYLRDGRPKVQHRALFTSLKAPFDPLEGAGEISGVVSDAFRKAGIDSRYRGSHAIRHSWATRMLQQGQSIKTIADLLGHRNLQTTLIYAKVDYSRLREVALPWPRTSQEVSS